MNDYLIALALASMPALGNVAGGAFAVLIDAGLGLVQSRSGGEGGGEGGP